jgi:Ca-activated chloride channel family protein
MSSTLSIFSDADYRAVLGDPGKTGTEAGFGALETPRGRLPLAALEVHARLDGVVAGIEVRQAFVNAHSEPLEATYIFPLPDRAAVTSFRLEVAGRVVEGDLQERGKARQQYDQAIRAGHRAAIAEEERAGVFTLRVGNLPPGERASVRLTLVGPLPYSDGEVTFRFPLVVAPRYIPGAALPGPATGTGTSRDTDAVPDASRISPPVLLPGFPNPVRLALSIEVPASLLGEHDFRSSLHAVVEDRQDNGRLFRVQPGERLDRDFILRYRLGSDRVHTALVVQPDARKADAPAAPQEEGTFLLTVMPPSQKGAVTQRPRDLVFVLDRSGSMGGWKMVAARRAVARMVETLTDHDRFAVYAFDDSIETPRGFDGTALVPATHRQRFLAGEFLAGIDARGGTEMEAPLVKAVEELQRGGAAGADRVLVLITDGQVGNEDAILRRLGAHLHGIRVFTLGIDRAVNAAFLRRLADLGGGASELVESEERLDAVMAQVHRHIGTAVLTDLAVEAAGLEVVGHSLVPARLPDLFAGTPLLISGRYRGSPQGAVRVRARDPKGESWSTTVQAWQDAAAPLSKVWARGRVRELEDRYAIDRGDQAKLEHEIVETSLRFGVLSRFTAYVAVDRAEVVNPGGEVKTVTQPVEQPAGWAQDAAGVTCAALGAFPAAGGAPMAMSLMRGDRSGAALRAARPCKSAPPPASSSAEPAYLSLPAGATPPTREEEDSGSTTCDFDAEALVDAEEESLSAPRGPKAKGRKAAKRSAGDPQASLWQRLLALFGLGHHAAAPALPLDRAAFRARVEALLQRLQAQASDAPMRRALLQAAQAELEALFRDLVTAGDRHESVERLGKQLATLKPLLLEASPAASAIDQVHLGIVGAFRDWLTLVAPAGSAAPAGGREGFWK